MRAFKTLMLTALAVSLGVLPAIAQTVDRNSATATEVSQDTMGVTTKTTAANPDTSIPGKVVLPQTIPPLSQIPAPNNGGGK